jgi:four helix bundle protein
MAPDLEDNRKDLRIRTKRFALDSIRFVQELPNDVVARTLGKQFLRSSTSVGANYRAARLARSDADMIAKLKIVEEEADESAFWLELLEESGVVSHEQTAPLTQESNELLRITIASIKTLRNRKPSERVRP